MKIDDDTLIAYLDAQLEDDAAYEAVEDALAESATLRARLQVLAETGELARQAFDAKLEEAVPPRLIAAIMDAPLPDAEASRAVQVRAHPAAAAAPDANANAATPGSTTARDPAQSAPAGDTPARTTTPTKAPISPPQRPTSARPATPGLGARLAAWLGQGFGAAAAFASIVTLALGALIGHYLLPPAELAAPLARQGDPVRNPAVAVALQAAPSGVAVDVGDALLVPTTCAWPVYSQPPRKNQFARQPRSIRARSRSASKGSPSTCSPRKASTASCRRSLAVA